MPCLEPWTTLPLDWHVIWLQCLLNVLAGFMRRADVATVLVQYAEAAYYFFGALHTTLDAAAYYNL